MVLRRDAPALARPRGVWLRIETMEVLLCVHYGEEHIGPELNGWRVAICSAGGPNAVQPPDHDPNMLCSPTPRGAQLEMPTCRAARCAPVSDTNYISMYGCTVQL